MFKCDCCGQCCRHITLSPIYMGLNRGDGVCRYLDEKSNLCTIYESRPIECNVDAMYKAYFSDKMTREEYYELNYHACEELKKSEEDNYVFITA